MRHVSNVRSVLLLAAILLPCARARAQVAPPPPKNFIGISVMGVAGFLRLNAGSFEAYYERVIARHHGLRLAGDFLHVHHNADHVQSHQWTFGGTLAYRYYAFDAQGPFGGLKVGYRRGFGHFGPPHPNPGHVHLQNEQILVLPQAGYRFLIPRAHLSIVTALGVGYAHRRVWAEDDSETSRAAVLTSQDNLGTTPLALDLELSLAYAF